MKVEQIENKLMEVPEGGQWSKRGEVWRKGARQHRIGTTKGQEEREGERNSK